MGVAEVGGARSTNGLTKRFLTTDCLPKATPNEIDVTDVVQVFITPQSFARRLIFQNDNTNIATTIDSSEALLLNANESLPLDTAGMKTNLYIGVDGVSTETNGLRLVFFDES